jgi:hypothetical protein
MREPKAAARAGPSAAVTLTALCIAAQILSDSGSLGCGSMGTGL